MGMRMCLPPQSGSSSRREVQGKAVLYQLEIGEIPSNIQMFSLVSTGLMVFVPGLLGGLAFSAVQDGLVV